MPAFKSRRYTFFINRLLVMFYIKSAPISCAKQSLDRLKKCLKDLGRLHMVQKLYHPDKTNDTNISRTPPPEEEVLFNMEVGKDIRQLLYQRILGFNLNAKGDHNPLIILCRMFPKSNNQELLLDLLQMLMTFNSDIVSRDTRDSVGNTALMYAAEAGLLGVVEILLAGYPGAIKMIPLKQITKKIQPCT